MVIFIYNNKFVYKLVTFISMKYLFLFNNVNLAFQTALTALDHLITNAANVNQDYIFIVELVYQLVLYKLIKTNKCLCLVKTVYKIVLFVIVHVRVV